MMIWEVSWRQTTHQTSCNLTARMRSTVYCPMRSSVTTVGKRGREISPSCFCHSQLIPSCPPPLHASSFLAAHRIWLRPSVFSTMMFSRQSDQTLPKTLATPFEHFLPPPLSRCPSPPFPSVSLQQKKREKKHSTWCTPRGFHVCCDWVCCYWARRICPVWEQACEKSLSLSILPCSSTSAGMLTFLPTSQCGILI